MTERFRIERVQTGPMTKTIGKTMEYYDFVDSTNSLLKRRARVGEEEGLVVVAKRQLRGRGRERREWCSLEGGLYLSILLRPPSMEDTLPLLTLLAGMILTQLLHEEYSLPVTMKWPNDIEYCGRKLSGILSQAGRDMNQNLYLVLGLGLNVNQRREIWPDTLKGQVTTLKDELGKELDLDRLLLSFLSRLEVEYMKFVQGELDVGYDPRLVEYSSTLGEMIKIESIDGVFIGEALGLTSRGSLVVECTDGICREFFVGDVTMVRKKRE